MRDKNLMFGVIACFAISILLLLVIIWEIKKSIDHDVRVQQMAKKTNDVAVSDNRDFSIYETFVGDDGGNYNIVSSTRSSISDALELQRERIALISKVYGAKVEQDEAYPGWAPNLNSSILEITTKIYAEMLDGEPNVCAIHAGLECGVIGEKVNGMDMISFGPTIKGPHSPDERVDIPSVKKFWDLLLRILEELAEK